jgi:hypothetical protein
LILLIVLLMNDGWRSWFGSKRRSGGGLAELLRDYAPYLAPHAAAGVALTEAQARANLAFFEQHRPQRLGQVAALLQAAAGINCAPALSDPARHGPALADALHRWAGSDWPALQPPQRGGLAAWLSSSRRDGDIVFSMLFDVGVLLGEVIQRGQPAWHWGLDLDPQNLADDMPSARRVVLLADPVGAAGSPFVLDVEDVVVHRFLHGQEASQRLLNPLRRLVEQGHSGEALAYWRDAAAHSR